MIRHPFRLRRLAAVAAVFAALAVGSARVRADVVPEPRPKSKPCVAPGQPCLTEGPEEAQDGTCVAATCTVQVRNRDGGTTPVAIPCFDCIVGAKGSKSKSSGCAVAPEPGDAGSPALAVSLLAGLMAAGRATPERRRMTAGSES